MTADPELRALTTPSDDTDATVGALLDQLTTAEEST
jgi:hypothetical protein